MAYTKKQINDIAEKYGFVADKDSLAEWEKIKDSLNGQEPDEETLKKIYDIFKRLSDRLSVLQPDNFDAFKQMYDVLSNAQAQENKPQLFEDEQVNDYITRFGNLVDRGDVATKRRMVNKAIEDLGNVEKYTKGKIKDAREFLDLFAADLITPTTFGKIQKQRLKELFDVYANQFKDSEDIDALRLAEKQYKSKYERFYKLHKFNAKSESKTEEQTPQQQYNNLSKSFLELREKAVNAEFGSEEHAQFLKQRSELDDKIIDLLTKNQDNIEHADTLLEKFNEDKQDIETVLNPLPENWREQIDNNNKNVLRQEVSVNIAENRADARQSVVSSLSKGKRATDLVDKYAPLDMYKDLEKEYNEESLLLNRVLKDKTLDLSKDERKRFNTLLESNQKRNSENDKIIKYITENITDGYLRSSLRDVRKRYKQADAKKKTLDDKYKQLPTEENRQALIKAIQEHKILANKAIKYLELLQTQNTSLDLKRSQVKTLIKDLVNAWNVWGTFRSEEIMIKVGLKEAWRGMKENRHGIMASLPLGQQKIYSDNLKRYQKEIKADEKQEDLLKRAPEQPTLEQPMPEENPIKSEAQPIPEQPASEEQVLDFKEEIIEPNYKDDADEMDKQIDDVIQSLGLSGNALQSQNYEEIWSKVSRGLNDENAVQKLAMKLYRRSPDSQQPIVLAKAYMYYENNKAEKDPSRIYRDQIIKKAYNTYIDDKSGLCAEKFANSYNIAMVYTGYAELCDVVEKYEANHDKWGDRAAKTKEILDVRIGNYDFKYNLKGDAQSLKAFSKDFIARNNELKITDLQRLYPDLYNTFEKLIPNESERGILFDVFKQTTALTDGKIPLDNAVKDGLHKVYLTVVRPDSDKFMTNYRDANIRQEFNERLSADRPFEYKTLRRFLEVIEIQNQAYLQRLRASKMYAQSSEKESIVGKVSDKLYEPLEKYNLREPFIRIEKIHRKVGFNNNAIENNKRKLKSLMQVYDQSSGDADKKTSLLKDMIEGLSRQENEWINQGYLYGDIKNVCDEALKDKDRYPEKDIQYFESWVEDARKAIDDAGEQAAKVRADMAPLQDTYSKVTGNLQHENDQQPKPQNELPYQQDDVDQGVFDKLMDYVRQLKTYKDEIESMYKTIVDLEQKSKVQLAPLDLYQDIDKLFSDFYPVRYEFYQYYRENNVPATFDEEYIRQINEIQDSVSAIHNNISDKYNKAQALMNDTKNPDRKVYLKECLKSAEDRYAQANADVETLRAQYKQSPTPEAKEKLIEQIKKNIQAIEVVQDYIGYNSVAKMMVLFIPQLINYNNKLSKYEKELSVLESQEPQQQPEQNAKSEQPTPEEHQGQSSKADAFKAAKQKIWEKLLAKGRALKQAVFTTKAPQDNAQPDDEQQGQQNNGQPEPKKVWFKDRKEMFFNLAKTALGSFVSSAAISTVATIGTAFISASGLGIIPTVVAAIGVLASIILKCKAWKKQNPGKGWKDALRDPAFALSLGRTGVTVLGMFVGAAGMTEIAEIISKLALGIGTTGNFIDVLKRSANKGYSKIETITYALLSVAANGLGWWAGNTAGKAIGEFLKGPVSSLTSEDSSEDTDADAKAENTQQPEKTSVKKESGAKTVEPDATEQAPAAQTQKTDNSVGNKTETAPENSVAGSDNYTDTALASAERISNQWYANNPTELAKRVELINAANAKYGTNLNPYRAVMLHGDAGGTTFDNTLLADTGKRSGGIHTIFTKWWANDKNVSLNDIKLVKEMFEGKEISEDAMKAALKLDKLVSDHNQIGQVGKFSNLTYMAGKSAFEK